MKHGFEFRVSREVVKMVEALERAPAVRRLLIYVALAVASPWSVAALVRAIRWW